MTTAEASKPVPAKPRRWWLLLFIALVLFGLLTSAFYWLAYIASAPDMSRVDHATTDELWAMGTNVIPVLAARARLRDNIFTTFYAKLYSKFPGELRRSFPRPVNRTPIRMHAMRAIAELGPLAARGAQSAVLEGLSDTNPMVRSSAVSAAAWIVRDSPQAASVFLQRLAATNRPLVGFFSLTVDPYIWPRFPQALPALINDLHDPEAAYEAAICLGYMGTNARAAIPALIDTLRHSAAGASPADEAKWRPDDRSIQQSTGKYSLDHNRAMSARALGRIGIATPEVTIALARAWNDTNEWVCANAAEAIGDLGPAMAGQVPELIAGLQDHDNRALSAKLLALGKIGPPAAGAIETLRQLTDPARVRQLVTDPNAEVISMRVGDIVTAAQTAICMIDPDRGKPYLPAIADAAVGEWWDPVECLILLKPLANEVVRAVEPLLQATNVFRRPIAAYVVLSQNPAHAAALEVLRDARLAGPPSQRLVAAEWLFLTTGETNNLCALIEEALPPTGSINGQTAASVAQRVGIAALPTKTAWQRALWDKDKFVRERAAIELWNLEDCQSTAVAQK